MCTSAVESVPLLAAGVRAGARCALYGMGMMFASMFLMLGREGWHLVNLAQEPVFLLSGTFFPIRSFNFWVAAGGVDYSADAGARRDSPVVVRIRRGAWFSRRADRDRRAGRSVRAVPDCSADVAAAAGTVGDRGGEVDGGKSVVGRSACGSWFHGAGF